MVELADTLDLGSSGQPWEFKSPYPHQVQRTRPFWAGPLTKRKNTIKTKPHYGWAVCAGCAMLLFCAGGLSVNAFTIYQPHILSRNGFTYAQSSLTAVPGVQRLYRRA